MQYFFFLLLILVGLALASRPVTVLIHELGHAVPVIFLTKQRATVYIGSYGNYTRSFKINLGPLTIFFHYNLFKWSHGLCVPSATTISINKQIIYTLTGPVASLLIAVIACYFTFTYDLHGLLKLFLIVFLGSALIDLLINLIPSKKPIILYDGRTIYNDGHNLKTLFYYKRLPEVYSKAVDLFNQQQYKEAAILFEKMLADGAQDATIHRLAISANLQNRQYEKVQALSDTFLLTGKMNSEDLMSMGFSYDELGFHDKAIELYDQSLQQDPYNKYSLNKKGYILNLASKFDAAISYFDRAIKVDKDFAYSYNNRGFAKIKSGQPEEGLIDIVRSLELDAKNAYSYRNLGIYHFDKGEFTKALPLFVKAKELNLTTHMIDELINDTEARLVNGS